MFNSRKKTEETAAEEVKKTEAAKEKEEPVKTDASADTAKAENASGEKKAVRDIPTLEKALETVEAELEKVKAETEKLKQETAKVKTDFDSLTDARLRLAAEYDNFRKRSQREKDAVYADSTASAVAALLPVIDNIERALAAENASAEDLRKGVEMIGTQASQAFEKLGVTPFGAVGEVFDPNLHHCVATVDTEDVKSGEIAMVLQKGYRLGDKVIRPAMVQVAN